VSSSLSTTTTTTTTTTIIIFGSCTRKTFDSFTAKDSYTWNITHNTESTAV
jgi:hypothetical protein